MKVQMIDVKNIKPYKNNPRKNENAIEGVKQSIQQYKFRQPIVVDKKNIIVIGHTRYYASQDLKLEKVPVHVAEDLTPKQIKALRIADNKTHEKAEWDFELLGKELAGVGNLFTGFEGDELKSILGDIEESDLPSLSSGDKDEFEQITFTLHNSQAEVVREALKEVKATGEVDDSLNENSNGNALFEICYYYMTDE